jgi:membrane associated rhomboid family serine protease
MSNQNQSGMQGMMPLTAVAKRLIILNAAIWFFGQVIIEQFFLKEQFSLVRIFGLVPARFFQDFYLWQPVTYMFLHDLNPTHILFNMLLIWWLGAELEARWGQRFFGVYYFVCGIGAALIYVLGALVYANFTGQLSGLLSPVVGASGAVFGLMVAYGILFGERSVLFMFLFQMKAKYFVMILAGIEVVMLLNHGVGGTSVANLAHVGGALTGFLFLMIWSRYLKSRKNAKTDRRHLKVVVSNESSKDPKYWN